MPDAVISMMSKLYCERQFHRRDVRPTPSSGSTRGWVMVGTVLRAAVFAAALFSAVPVSAHTVTIANRSPSSAVKGTVLSTSGSISPAISCTTGTAAGCSGNATGMVRLEWQEFSNAKLSSWSGCTSTPTVNGKLACDVNVTAARTVSANFTQANWTLTARSILQGGASVALGLAPASATTTPVLACAGGATCQVQASASSIVVLRATPAVGSVVAWSGCSSVAGNDCSVNMTASRAVTATATPAAYSVSLSIVGSGLVSGASSTGDGIACPGDCSATLPAGGALTLTATPGALYAFSSWNGCASNAGATCTVHNNKSSSITAVFEKISCESCHGTPPSDHQPIEPVIAGCSGCHAGYTVSTAAAVTHLNGTFEVACSGCHAESHGEPDCRTCHGYDAQTFWTLSNGKHDNGIADVKCGGCHAAPPTVGAHAAHFGLTGDAAQPRYGDTRTLQDLYPEMTPTSAPGVYAFGCGNCHPVDSTKHRNGTVDVVLWEAAAPFDSPKGRAFPVASYDPATGNCSGVYCHSSGQAAPTYLTTPAWTSGAGLGCADCHANPPRYNSGGAGTATANSHVNLADDGYEFGHFGGMIGPWLESRHGVSATYNAAPITCQTCHSETVDPANTGPSGFYYLDTSGSYQLPGGWAGRIGSLWYARLRCDTCHSSTHPTAPLGTGKVLPLRHVNGVRDVTFDTRQTLPPIPWLPAAPNIAVKPYWFTQGNRMSDWPESVIWNGWTASFDLSNSSYDAARKTCTNVACHMAENPVWGTPYQYYTNGGPTCYACHPNF